MCTLSYELWKTLNIKRHSYQNDTFEVTCRWKDIKMALPKLKVPDKNEICLSKVTNGWSTRDLDDNAGGWANHSNKKTRWELKSKSYYVYLRTTDWMCRISNNNHGEQNSCFIYGHMCIDRSFLSSLVLCPYDSHCITLKKIG